MTISWMNVFIVFFVGLVSLTGYQLWLLRCVVEQAERHLTTCREVVKKHHVEFAWAFVKDTFESNPPFLHLVHVRALAILLSVFLTALGIAFIPTPDAGDSIAFLEQIHPRFLGIAFGPLMAIINIFVVQYAENQIGVRRSKALNQVTSRPAFLESVGDELRNLQTVAADVTASLREIKIGLEGTTTTFQDTTTTFTDTATTLKYAAKTLHDAVEKNVEFVGEANQSLGASAESAITRIRDTNTAAQSTIADLAKEAVDVSNAGIEAAEVAMAKIKEVSEASQDEVRALGSEIQTALKGLSDIPTSASNVDIAPDIRNLQQAIKTLNATMSNRSQSPEPVQTVASDGEPRTDPKNGFFGGLKRRFFGERTVQSEKHVAKLR